MHPVSSPIKASLIVDLDPSKFNLLSIDLILPTLAIKLNPFDAGDNSLILLNVGLDNLADQLFFLVGEYAPCW